MKNMMYLKFWVLLLLVFVSGNALATPGSSNPYQDSGLTVFEYPTYEGIEINDNSDTFKQWAGELGYIFEYAEYECYNPLEEYPNCSSWSDYETYGHNDGSWEAHLCSYNDWDNCYNRPKKIFAKPVIILHDSVSATGSLSNGELEDYKILTSGGEVAIELDGDVIAGVAPLGAMPGLPNMNLVCPGFNVGDCPDLGLVPGLFGTPDARQCTLSFDQPKEICIRVFGSGEDTSYKLTANFNDAGGIPEAQKEEHNFGHPDCKDKYFCGDPINIATGAQVLSHDLLSVQGVLPLSFSINYHSLLLTEGILGRAWGHNRFDASLQELSNGDVEVHWTTNQFNLFTKNADGSYNPSHVATHFDFRHFS